MKQKILTGILFLCCAGLIIVLVSGHSQHNHSVSAGVYSHVQKGTITEKTTQLSLVDTGEFYLLTTSGDILQMGTYDVDDNSVAVLKDSDNEICGYVVPTGRTSVTVVFIGQGSMHLAKTDNAARVPTGYNE